MKIKRFMCGSLLADGYVIWNRDKGSCMVIDPGYEARGYVDFVKEKGLALTKILLTHHHYDHTDAAGITWYEPKNEDYKLSVGITVEDGQLKIVSYRINKQWNEDLDIGNLWPGF